MKEKKKMPKWLVIVIIILGVALIGALFGGNNTSNNTSNKTTTKKEEIKKDSYEVNKPFEFDELEITIGNEISFTTLDNEFSDLNGSDVVKVPITVKNKKDESHQLNMFYLKTFGTQGTQLDDVSSYFMDQDAIEFAGELMPEASYTKYLYFLYDGNGTYVIKFDNYSKKIEFKLDIQK